MEQIKFRAWHKNKMLYDVAVIGGCLAIEENPLTEDCVTVNIGGNFSHYHADWSKYELKRYAILMQYSGLNDKNKKESYRNDICKYEYQIFNSSDPDHSPLQFSGKGIIVFEQATFWIKDINTKKTVPLHYQELSFEIIGNIHENKDLS